MNQMLKVRIVNQVLNKMSFLILMTSKRLLVIRIIKIWTGNVNTNIFNQNRKIFVIPSQETLLSELEIINYLKTKSN